MRNLWRILLGLLKINKKPEPLLTQQEEAALDEDWAAYDKIMAQEEMLAEECFNCSRPYKEHLDRTCSCDKFERWDPYKADIRNWQNEREQERVAQEFWLEFIKRNEVV